MKYCICGAQLPENARFCPACGIPCATEQEAVPVPELENLLTPEPVAEDIPVEEDGTPMETGPVAEEDPVPEISPMMEEHDETHEEIPGRTKKHRPVLIPVVMMALMLIVGTVCFFLLPGSTMDEPEGTEPVMGNHGESPLPPSPNGGQNQRPTGDGGQRSEIFVPTEESCFVLAEDGLHFLPQKYDGSKVLVIPNEIGGVAVTAIAPSGFAGCEGVTTLILPDSLETIGAYAFAGCAELRGVWFPGSMREIGEGAFRGCIGLEAVSVQSGMEVIGRDAFTGCARLLYFFYDGYYEDWVALYNEYVTPYTSVTCLDGDYYHGVELP